MKRVLLLPSAVLLLLAASIAGAQVTHQYWMCPNTNTPDFKSMFDIGAAWTHLKRSDDVFKMYIGTLTSADNAFIDKAIASLNAAGIKFAVEAGGLRPFSGCGSLAGETHATTELVSFNKWLARGGTIDYIAMDSPINTMIAGGAPGNCGLSVYQAANELADYMYAVRQVIPNVKFGWIEPVPWYTVPPYPNHPGNNYGDLIKTMDTVLRVLNIRGEQLEFFHADSPYDYSENAVTQGWKKLKVVEDHVRSKGLRFGLIFNTDIGGNTSDSMFYAQTMDGWPKYTAQNGNPDDIIVQSWYQLPTLSMPENQRYTFTLTADKFFDQVINNGPKVVAVDAARVAGSAYRLNAVPNPAGAGATFMLTLPTAGHLRLELFSATGERAAVLVDEMRDAGEQRVPFDAATFPAGVYMARAVVDGVVEMRSFVVTR